MAAWSPRRRLADERGTVLVLVAILLPVLLGIAALVIDVGSWYQQKQQLQAAADAAALAGAQDLPRDPATAQSDARAYAAKNIAGATVTPVTPYNSDSQLIRVTVSKPAASFFGSVLGIDPPTITVSSVARATVGSGSSAFYAASTDCNAIAITHGDQDFTQADIWTNGGVIASGSQDFATNIYVGNSACLSSFPSQLTPPGPTSVAPFSSWPQPLPPVPSSCGSGNISIGNASWLVDNPPGVYCTTGTITIGAKGVTFNGYEFISEAAVGGAISTTNGPNTFIGAGTPQTVFYATAGGIKIGNPETFTGNLYAVGGTAEFTGGSLTVTGFIEAWKIGLNNGPYTFIGNGPNPSTLAGISLQQ